MRRIARALTSVALVATLASAILVTAPTTAGASSPDEEAQFVAKINDLRASKGLPPMTPNPGLAATACTWNDQMIAAGQISHDPNLANEIESVVPDWSKGGENVGMGGTIDSLFDAFVASPGHYKNLVDPDFSLIGVCVGRDASNKLFTTHRFVAVRGAAAPPPPPTTAPPTTAPPTTAPPTTAPPTTAVAATAPAPTAPSTTAPRPSAPPTTAAPPPTPPTTAPRPTAPPITAAVTTAAPTTAALATTAGATEPTSSGSSTTASESTTTPSEPNVRELLAQIIELFPAFLHLRLP